MFSRIFLCLIREPLHMLGLKECCLLPVDGPYWFRGQEAKGQEHKGHLVKSSSRLFLCISLRTHAPDSHSNQQCSSYTFLRSNLRIPVSIQQMQLRDLFLHLESTLKEYAVKQSEPYFYELYLSPVCKLWKHCTFRRNSRFRTTPAKIKTKRNINISNHHSFI